MAPLSATARTAIRESGIPLAEWFRMWGYVGRQWGGDRCGCLDDRCIGHHHDGEDRCGCLGQMIDDAVRWRRATRHPGDVELTGLPWGLSQSADISTPHAVAMVSTSQRYVGPTVNGVVQVRPEETSIRIRPREGWTAVIGEDDWFGEKCMVIRLVKAPVPQ